MDMDSSNPNFVHNKVSVIMGIFNCADTLSESIESIIAQTYDNWELIMCDDGSLDNTWQIAESYQAKMPYKIRLIRHEQNKGLNITLNDCLAFANGEFIARMDGDDISLPQRFEKQVGFLKQNPEYSIVSCPMIYFDESGEWGRGTCIEKPQKTDFAQCCPFCHAPAMVRIEAYRKCKGYSLNQWTIRCEDFDLWARMYALGFRGFNIIEPLYMMRDNRTAFHRRTLRFSINAFVTRLRVARMLSLPWRAYVRSLRPMLVALLPWPVYRHFHLMKKQRP